MATPVLNNGLFTRDTNYEIGSNIDSYHLRHMLGEPKPMDLGPIEIWAQLQKVEAPLYQISSFNGKNVIMVDSPNGEYKWTTPVTNDLPYIVEDIESSNTTKGIDGTTFKIKVNRKAFGPTDIISCDKYNGAELYVTAEPAIPTTDGIIYTVKMVNDSNYSYFDNKYLANGTKFFVKASARSGEYGEAFSEINTQMGFREYYNYVGDAEANVKYHISSRADLIMKGGLNADGTMPVTEIWRSYDKNIDPSVKSPEDIVKIMGKDYAKKAYANGTLSKAFLTKLEAAHLTKISNDIENYLMWGRGGFINDEGPDSMRLSVGLWRQLDKGPKRIYNKNNFSMDMFRSEIYNFFRGKVEFKGPDSQRKLIVQTGLGGFNMINEALKNETFAGGGNVNMAKDGINAVSGNPMSLHYGFSFTSYSIPFLANVHFVINPALDPVNNNEIGNPTIDGHPLSSYSFIIFDVTDTGSDNIKMLKSAHDNQLKWWYQNGTMDYMGKSQGFASVGNFSGYRVMMSQRMPSIVVLDPTRVLKFVMRNPITGFAL